MLRLDFMFTLQSDDDGCYVIITTATGDSPALHQQSVLQSSGYRDAIIGILFVAATFHTYIIA